MMDKRQEVAFVYRKKRTFADLVGGFIDLYVARRIGRTSREFNLARRGKMAIFANDYIGIQINQHGFFEGSVLDMVFAFLGPVLDHIRRGVALDIGANIENHSVYFSRHFSTVMAFEPHPRTFELFSFNAKIADNIVPFPFGLGEADQSVDLHENPENMGSASAMHKWTTDGGTVTVEIRRLDGLDLGADPISLMKIDVEGLESSVVRGARETIRKHQPLILMEQLESEFVDGSTESIEFLRREGYVFCWYQPWAASRGWVERRLNTARNLLLGGTYDYNFLTGAVPPPATYEMLIAVPRRCQSQLLHNR